MRNLLKRTPDPLIPSAVTAANWWAGFLRAYYAGVDNDSFPRGRRRDDPTDELIAIFNELLARKFTDELNRLAKIASKRRNLGWDYEISFHVDNGPSGILKEALLEAGFKSWDGLPIKTFMSIRRNEVSVNGHDIPLMLTPV